MFSISTVASSTRMPTASAMPPSVITLIVWPIRLRMISEVRIESGIEMHTISVLRQLPRNSRIIRPVSTAAIDAFAHHAVDRRPARTAIGRTARVTFSAVGSAARMLGSAFFTSIDDVQRGGLAALAAP